MSFRSQTNVCSTCKKANCSGCPFAEPDPPEVKLSAEDEANIAQRQQDLRRHPQDAK